MVNTAKVCHRGPSPHSSRNIRVHKYTEIRTSVERAMSGANILTNVESTDYANVSLKKSFLVLSLLYAWISDDLSSIITGWFSSCPPLVFLSDTGTKRNMEGMI